MKYIKNPEVLDIIMWVGNNEADILALIGDNFSMGSVENSTDLTLKSWEGDKYIKINDYIIKGEDGRLDCVANIDFSGKYTLKV